MVVVTIVVVVRGAVVVVCSAFVVVVVDPALEFEPLETNTPTIASTAIAKTAAPATIHFRFDDESELFGSRGVPADPGEAVFGGGGGGGRVAPKGGDSGFASELLGGGIRRSCAVLLLYPSGSVAFTERNEIQGKSILLVKAHEDRMKNCASALRTEP